MTRYEERLDDIARFLTLAVRAVRTEAERGEFEQLYRTLGYDLVRSAARKNQVEAMVAQAVVSVNRDADPRWVDLLESNDKRVRTLTEALKGVLCRLEAVGCRTAVVENAGVMFGSKMPLSAFCAGDFDLVVDQHHWVTVQRAFEAEGFVARDRRNRPTNRLEFCKRLDDGRELWLNPGYLSFDRMWVPLSYTDRTPEWLERRVPSEIEPEIHVLSPADALAFVAMHTSLHSFVRPPGIRLHTDVDRLVRDNPIDWDLFLHEVRAMGVPTRAFVSLSMAEGLLGTPIPDTVLQQLHPGERRWQALMGLLATNGVFVTGRKKLPHVYTVYLDVLLSEQGFWPWLRSVVLPPADWMQAHFDREGLSGGSIWRLHLNRGWKMLLRGRY